MHRRAFLSGLLAAPVVITTPGLLMPVRALAPDVPADWKFWQDLAGVIPAVKNGDPIMLARGFGYMLGAPVDMVAPSLDRAPVLAGVGASPYILFDGGKEARGVRKNGA